MSEVTKQQAFWLEVHVLLCTTSEQLSALLCSALQGAYKHALVRFNSNLSTLIDEEALCTFVL